MRCTNFLSGAITSARLTPCQKSICKEGRWGNLLRQPKSPRYSTAGFLAPQSHHLEHLNQHTCPKRQAHSVHKGGQVGKLDTKTLKVTNLRTGQGAAGQVVRLGLGGHPMIHGSLGFQTREHVKKTCCVERSTLHYANMDVEGGRSMERERQLLSVVRAEGNVLYYFLCSAFKHSQAHCGFSADMVSCPWLYGDLLKTATRRGMVVLTTGS